MLLGSPPDMVHGSTLRRTDSSLPLIWVRQHSARPGAGIHPCCSGLQVQGTANSPTSATLFRARSAKQVLVIIQYPTGIINNSSAIFFFFSQFDRKILFTISENLAIISKLFGPVAQLGARSVRIREVEGSNPFRSTICVRSSIG